MDGKVVAIIQARMGSTRLPGKIMKDVAGRPLLAQVIRRARAARTLDRVAVATSDAPPDNIVETLCEDAGVPCFRGSEEDVLDRYYRAAERFEAGTIVRLTADCPLLDPEVIDRVVREFGGGEYDYMANIHPPTFPDGLDTEVFTRQALECAWREAVLRSDREHVTPFIWRQPDRFRLGNVTNTTDLSACRWTVDEPQDLEFVRLVYSRCDAGDLFGMEEVLRLLRAHPELQGLNTGLHRNEGYEKSIRADQVGG
jgi:spore coat polysaccharide biosynthesis protein SpsF (cytidylyltransferase family)